MTATTDWYDFAIAGTKVGFTAILRGDAAAQVATTYSYTRFTMEDEEIESRFFYTSPAGDRARWLSFGTVPEDGVSIEFRRAGGALVAVDDDRVVLAQIPEDAYPTQAYELVLERLELRTGRTIAYTALSDGDGAVIGRSEMRVGEAVDDPGFGRVHLVLETMNGQRGRRFWVAGDRRVVQIDWNGPISRLGKQAEVLAGLPQRWGDISSIRPFFP
ncbi:MAG TPA: hypothetical protein VEL07_16190 [Planctomycetota bacterium]|nr:hypothetical protein [Planctomycetota bacterium]